MPAILILGFDLELTRVMLVGILGGLLGILMMIPLRRALIVKQHGALKYPEGTACAAVLTAGASAESRAAASPAAQADMAAAAAAGLGRSPGGKVIFTRLRRRSALQDAQRRASRAGRTFRKRSSARRSRRLGRHRDLARTARRGLHHRAAHRLDHVRRRRARLPGAYSDDQILWRSVAGPLAPGTMPIAEMEPDEIRGAYVLYIGAGAVAAGGIISVFRSLPTIWHGLRAGLGRFQAAAARRRRRPAAVPRTDRDLSMKFVGIGCVALIAAIVLAPAAAHEPAGRAADRASSASCSSPSRRGSPARSAPRPIPISGMTVATLLLTCLIFLLVGWTGGTYYVTALSVGGSSASPRPTAARPRRT